MFDPSSRYHGLPEATLAGPDNRAIRYVTARIIPDTPAARGHILAGAERLDLVAFHYYREPERFWRICDANAALYPPDLETQVGRKIGIPEP